MILKDYLERKIADLEKEIQKYEKKYAMSFEEFEKKINNKKFAEELEKKHGIIQVENDYFDWGGAVTDFRFFKGKLEKLSR